MNYVLLRFQFSILFVFTFLALLSQSHQKAEELTAKADELVFTDKKQCERLLSQAYSLSLQVKDRKKKDSLLAENYLIRSTLYTSDLQMVCLADSFAKLALNKYQLDENWKGMSGACINLTNIHLLRNEREKSLSWIKRAIDYALCTDKPEFISEVYYNYSYIVRWIYGSSEALPTAYKALGIAERSGDSSAIAMSHFLLFDLNHDLEKYKDAESNIRKTLHYAPIHFRGDAKIRMWNKLGQILSLNESSYPEALKAYETGLRYAIAYDDKCEALKAYTGIGNILAYTQKWEKASAYFEKSKGICGDIGSEPTFYLVSLAKVYSIIGETEKSLVYLEKFKEETKTFSIVYQSIDQYKEVALIYAGHGKFKEAFEYNQLWNHLSDSLRNAEHQSLLAELEKKYQSEKKDTRIAYQELALAKSKNKHFWMSGIFVLILLGGGISIFFIRYRAQKEKQALQIQLKQSHLNKVLFAQEEERRRIARELHDGLGQSLAALKMQLQMAGDTPSSQKSIHSVDILCREVRQLSHQMMPVVLQEHGLKEALELLVNESFTGTEIETNLVILGLDTRLDEISEIHLYRMAQELISNVIKHSNARRVGIQLLERKNKVFLIVEDDGVGFEDPVKGGGMGLNNIHSRLDTLNGEIEIESGLNQGTIVHITLPLNDENKMSA